jgi:hypothetical protein
MTYDSKWDRIDASHSTFNNIGRDQINVTYVITNSSGLHSDSDYSSYICGNLRRPQAAWIRTGTSRGLGSADGQATGWTEVSIIDHAIDLIGQIEVALSTCDSKYVGIYRNLRQELQSLHFTLCLTKSALQSFERTPLRPSLAITFSPEVERCFLGLRDTYDKISRCRRRLSSTTINYLWTVVYSNGWDNGELDALQQKLYLHRETLDGFLIALNSCVSLSLSLSSVHTMYPHHCRKCRMGLFWWLTARKPRILENNI